MEYETFRELPLVKMKRLDFVARAKVEEGDKPDEDGVYIVVYIPFANRKQAEGVLTQAVIDSV